jgi:HEAT repeat protein
MRPIFDEHEQSKRAEKPQLEETLSALQLIENEVIPAKVYYGLSGLTSAEIEQLKVVWDKLPASLRRKLLLELAETNELNFDLDYRELGLFGLQDADSSVRTAAIELLWLDESLEFMSKLIDLSQWDDNFEVRAAAVSDLGRFILLGEYEEIPEREAIRAQDVAIQLLTNDQEDLEVRRRALEAISNCSHDIVAEAIQEAYDSSERLMRVSSIFAMGRSCDRRWWTTVLKEMNSEDEELRYEAARAAGELQLEEAVMPLGAMAARDDREIKEAAIWSLGEIGGREAVRILSALAQDAEEMDDDDLLEAVEDAISNASLVGELVGLELDDED